MIPLSDLGKTCDFLAPEGGQTAGQPQLLPKGSEVFTCDRPPGHQCQSPGDESSQGQLEGRPLQGRKQNVLELGISDEVRFI